MFGPGYICVFEVCFFSSIIAKNRAFYVSGMYAKVTGANTYAHTQFRLFVLTSLPLMQEVIVSLEIDKKDIRTSKGQIGRKR